MKKSEAEKIIADFLADFEPSEFREETEDAASGLLHSLLQAGMTPPDWSDKAKKTLKNENGTHLWELEAEERFEAFSWEPEDEA